MSSLVSSCPILHKIAFLRDKRDGVSSHYTADAISNYNSLEGSSFPDEIRSSISTLSVDPHKVSLADWLFCFEKGSQWQELEEKIRRALIETLFKNMTGDLNVTGHFKSMTDQDCQRKLVTFLENTSKQFSALELLPPKTIPPHERVMLFISSCLQIVHGQVAFGINRFHKAPVKSLLEIAAFTVIGYNLYKNNRKTFCALTVSSLFFFLFPPYIEAGEPRTLADRFFDTSRVRLFDRRLQTYTEPINQYVRGRLQARLDYERNREIELEREGRETLDRLLQEEVETLFSLR